MLTHPAFLSFFSGLIVVALVYYIKKSQKEEQYNNGQFGLLFLVVSGLVYGSCFIVGEGDGTDVSSVLSECPVNSASNVFTGTPEF